MTTFSNLVFPHEPLTPIIGRPNYSSIQTVKKELYANAIAIASTHWGGGHGHLGLVMPTVAYETLANVAFVPLPTPVAPVHPTGATGPQITEANRAFDALQRDFTLMTVVTTRLRSLLINAVEPMYFAELQDPELGLSYVTVKTMLEKLTADHGTVTPADLEANRASLLTAWDVTLSIEQLWIRHTAIKQLAIAGNEPLSDNVVMEQTIVLFHNAGVFELGLDAWRRMPQTSKTYAAFKTHFTAENKERIQKLTVKEAGYYHRANAAMTQEPDMSGDNLAAAVKKVTITPPKVKNAYQVTTADGTCYFYCWSHGLGLNQHHTSHTCKNKREGHLDNATLSTINGGSARIMTKTTKLPSPAE